MRCADGCGGKTAGAVPTTVDMPWLTWEQSAARFTEVIFDGLWDATYHVDRQGSDPDSRCQTEAVIAGGVTKIRNKNT